MIPKFLIPFHLLLFSHLPLCSRSWIYRWFNTIFLPMTWPNSVFLLHIGRSPSADVNFHSPLLSYCFLHLWFPLSLHKPHYKKWKSLRYYCVPVSILVAPTIRLHWLTISPDFLNIMRAEVSTNNTWYSWFSLDISNIMFLPSNVISSAMPMFSF